MRTKLIAAGVVFLSASGGSAYGQATEPTIDQLKQFLAPPSCIGSLPSGPVRCEGFLGSRLDARKSKAGDHVLIAISTPAQVPLKTLDATIVEARTERNGRSMLRIRIDKARAADGRELQIEARIVAVASALSVTEGWRYPVIIVDRFPRIPQDDERLPGERKVSEDEPHTSPLDSLPEVPVRYRAVCAKPQEIAVTSGCTNLLDAKGVYGYKAARIEPEDAGASGESLVTSKKNIRFGVGTVLVLEIVEARTAAPREPT